MQIYADEKECADHGGLVWVYMSAMINKNKTALLGNNLLVLGTIGLRTYLRKSAFICG
jgi:hypothetical protein